MLEFIDETIGYYNFTALLGAAAALAVIFILRKRTGMDVSDVIYLFIMAMIGVLAGGHLMFFLVNLPEWLSSWAGRIRSVQEFLDAFLAGCSGSVFYGGLIGALLMVRLFCKLRFQPVRRTFNYAVTVFPLFHAFGRVGCYLTGCCYGIEYHGPFAVTYTGDYAVAGVSDDIADFSRFPVQLLEAALELIIFVILLIIYLKTADKYSITCIYVISYGVVRFFDEFLRGDSYRRIRGPLSTSQWISIVLVAAAVIYLLHLRKKEKYAG